MSQFVLFGGDGRVATILSSTQEIPGATKVPDDFSGSVGMHRKEFDERWKVRPLSNRVNAGFVPIPEGYKLEGETLAPMTQIERYEAGIDPIPKGAKILEGALVPLSIPELAAKGELDIPPGYKVTDGENPQIVAMDDEELLDAGLITFRMWTERKADAIDAEWMRRLYAGFLFSDGNTYPLDDGALGAWGRFVERIRLGVSVSPYARTVDNENTTFMPEDFVRFYLSASEESDALQAWRSEAKDAIRACSTSQEALTKFNEYRGGA